MVEHVRAEPEKILVCGLNLQEITSLLMWLNALLHAVQEKDWNRVKDYKASEIQQYIDIMQRAKAEFGPHGLLDATEMFGTLLFHVRDQKGEEIKEDLAFIFAGFLDQSITQVARLQLRLV